VISIKKLLSSESRGKDHAFEQMAYRLLEAISMNAAPGERVDLDHFQATLGGVLTILEHNPSPEEIMAAADSTVVALRTYNRNASRSVDAKSVELQAMVGMLTHAMSKIATASEKSIARLQELKTEIQQAVMIEDVRALKTQLAVCLQSISGEVARQRDESNRMILDLKEDLRLGRQAKSSQALAAPAEPGECDPLTGLLQRPAAEAAIAAVCEEGSHVYAGLFVMDRIQSIKARFGKSLGDQALVFFMQYLSQALAPADKVFRWSSASFLALMERSEPADQVRKQLVRNLARRTEQTLEIEGRSVVLPVSSTWIVAPLFENGYRENLHKLDLFCESLRRA
jgi:GGDEF domain-containing protein